MNRRLRAIIATLVILSASGWSGTMSAAASGGVPTVTTQRGTQIVDLSTLQSQPSVTTRVTRDMFGINVATWDYQMEDPSTIPTIDTLGTRLQQFPNAGPWYNWRLNKTRSAQTNYTTWNTYQEGMSLAQWGAILTQTHNHGLYIVDYGTNASWTGGATVDDTVAVTKYIVGHHLPVTAMVIGSEVYGTWAGALNLHHDKSARKYATVAKAMAIAIHEIAPRMQVGVDLMPIPPGPPDPAVVNWNRTVLSIDAPYVQFVSVHYYPITRKVTDAGLLRDLGDIPQLTQTLQDEVNTYAGKFASGIQMWITEFNPYLVTPTVQTVNHAYGAALAESILSWVSSGVHEVVWWSLHGAAHKLLPNGTYDPRSDLVPNTAYGTYALASDGVAPEPAINTLYPSGRAYATIMAAIGGGAELTTWPTVLYDHDLFVARIERSGKVTWVLVNASAKATLVVVNGQRLTLSSAALRIVQGVTISKVHSSAPVGGSSASAT